MLFFQFQQCAEHPVVLGIRNVRLVEDMIEVIVAVKFCRQMLVPDFRLRVGHGSVPGLNRDMKSSTALPRFSVDFGPLRQIIKGGIRCRLVTNSGYIIAQNSVQRRIRLRLLSKFE